MTISVSQASDMTARQIDNLRSQISGIVSDLAVGVGTADEQAALVGQLAAYLEDARVVLGAPLFGADVVSAVMQLEQAVPAAERALRQNRAALQEAGDTQTGGSGTGSKTAITSTRPIMESIGLWINPTDRPFYRRPWFIGVSVLGAVVGGYYLYTRVK